MVCTEKNFEELSSLYERIIYLTLKLHNVREVVCENEKEHYFDRIVTRDDGLEVFTYGFEKPSKRLYFDFTNDYARCLSYIEDSIYVMLRGGNAQHGMVIYFNN